MRHFTIPVFVPELACPNRCVFCNQHKISGALCQPAGEEVVETIEKRLSTIAPGNEVEIGFFGGNFTGIETELQEQYLSLAQRYVDRGLITGIRLSTRPDYIDENSLRLLKKYAVTTIELGAQSLDEQVLILAGRGHSVDDVKNASRLILKNGFQLGLQMMIGLPGDTPVKSISTAEQIVSLGATNTRIYPTLVIRDTGLELLYRKGEYIPLKLEEAIRWTKDIVKIFEAGNVAILRIGLHPSDGILNGDTLVAGPFHVAFGEMVTSALWRDEFERELIAMRGAPGTADRKHGTRHMVHDREFKHPGSGNPIADDLLKQNNASGKLPPMIAEIPAGQLNAAVGHHAENKKILLEYFQMVIFRENPELRGRQFRFLLNRNE